jgi:FKBP-type peptidyl-prolyl cis-trans isomerase 2
LVALGLAALAVAFAGCAGSSGSDAAAVGQATLAPGTSANVPMLVDNVTASEPNVTVTDSGLLEASLSGEATVSGGVLAAWLNVQVPEDAEDGTTEIMLDVEDRSVAVLVDVQTVEESLPNGATAQVSLTARTSSGEVAVTTQRLIADAPFAKTEDFQPRRQYQPIPVQISPQARLPGELVSRVAQSAVNHSFSVDVPKAFGPAAVEQNETREETINKTRTDQRSVEFPKDPAQQQGLISEDVEEGDEVTLPGRELPYVAAMVNGTHVRIEVDAQQGDNVTLYEAWPNQSTVTNVTEDEITFHTDPEVEPGKAFTWRTEWPKATEITAETNETITLRHTPDVGTAYEQQTRRGQTVNVTVKAVEPDRIVVSQDNPHPLAGQTITFEVTVEGVQSGGPSIGGAPSSPGGR